MRGAELGQFTSPILSQGHDGLSTFVVATGDFGSIVGLRSGMKGGVHILQWALALLQSIAGIRADR